jgi:hypothetical protein
MKLKITGGIHWKANKHVKCTERYAAQKKQADGKESALDV